MNRVNHIYVGAALVLFAVTTSAYSAADDRFSGLLVLTGCWQVEAEEENSLGNGFKQEGTLRVRSILDGRALEFSQRYEVSEATGLYTSLSKVRLFRQEISFDSRSNTLTVASTRPEDPAPTIKKSAISSDGRRIFQTFMFYHPRRGMTLFGEEYINIESANEVNTINRIRDVFGDYRETYTATWTRQSESTDSCPVDSR